MRPTATLLYGRPKIGKTTAAITWPKPVFIVPGQEKGTASLHAAKKLHGVDYEVDILEVSSIADMEDALQIVQTEYEKKGWRTVVLDPWTSYSLIAEIEMREGFSGKDTRQMYGELRQHQLNVWRALQGLPLHTLWICHETTDDSPMAVKGPWAVGSAIKVLMANVDLIAYMMLKTVAVRDAEGELKKDKDGQVITKDQRVIITREFPEEVFGREFEANARWNDLLPEGVYTPKWSAFAKRLKSVAKVD